jgi:hypothetical protein
VSGLGSAEGGSVGGCKAGVRNRVWRLNSRRVGVRNDWVGVGRGGGNNGKWGGLQEVGRQKSGMAAGIFYNFIILFYLFIYFYFFKFFFFI